MSNKYNSKQDFFIATDLYNLPLPVLPPADLSISAASTVPSYLFYRKGTSTKVAGFSPTDNAYIRALGLSSNLADGLVAKNASVGPGAGWGFRLRPRLFAAGISAVTNTSGTDQITGGAGRFETHLAPGMTVMWLDDGDTVRIGVISTIAAGGNSLTLTAVTGTGAGTMFANNTTSAILYPLIKNAGNSLDFSTLTLNNMTPASFFMWSPSTVYAPRGKMTVAAGGTAVTGVGTFFQTDFDPSEPIAYTDDAGVRRTGFISAIASETSMTLTAGSAAIAAATNSAVLDINSFIAIEATIITAFQAYTITIDPLFGDGTRRISLNVMAEIEYTFPLVAAGDLGL